MDPNCLLKCSDLTKDQFLKCFNEYGYVIVEDVYSKDFVTSIIPELETAIEKESQAYHSKDHKDYGMLLACPIYGGRFLTVLENQDFFKPFNWVLGETSIIWVYTSSSLAPDKGNHASQIHVDRPFFIPNFNEGIGSLILLNDFTEENGATFFLPKSQLKADKPDPLEFYKNAERLIAPKGSVFYFNLRMWHAGGINNSNQWRHALGIGGIRPYYKQRIDLPRIMKKEDIDQLSDQAKQKLGCFAQPPTSLQEYYSNTVIKEKLQPSEWKEE